MGVDLTLVIIAEQAHKDLPHLGYDRLSTDRWEERLDDISALSPREFPTKLSWYDDEGLEDIGDDAYGEKLTYLFADQLAPLFIKDSQSRWNKAVGCFLLALPAETRVVLYWY